MRRRTANWKPILGQQGFTVLELLVALALTALIVTALFGTFRFARRAWQTSGDIEQTASVSAVQSFLTAAIAQAQPAADPPLSSPLAPSFDGRPDRLVFVAPSSVAVTTGGSYRFEILLDEETGRDGTKRSLFVVQTLDRNVRRKDAAATAFRRKGLSNVAGLRFRYFGVARGNTTPSWYDAWSSEPALPRLIEVTVSFLNGDPRVWPPLVVEPKL